MIFVGDIACPSKEMAESFERDMSSIPAFHQKGFVGNLEGLVGVESLLDAQEPIVYNHPSIIPALERVGFNYLALANNHVLDVVENFEKTCSLLEQAQIDYSGFDSNNKEFQNWKLTKDVDGTEIYIYNACWEFLLYNQDNSSGKHSINIIEFQEIFKSIREFKKIIPNAILVVYLHWSFDLETLPFPMYRKWSKDLIDAGVKLVVGCHSHCVQGAEQYKDGNIVYGLGNFFFPSNYYANGKLVFPKLSKMQLAFEFDFQNNKPLFHWLEFSKENKLKYLNTESIDDSKTLSFYSPYQGMTDEEYLKYFKINRRKSKLIPVFIDYTNTTKYKFKLHILIFRARVARSLAKMGLINWQT